RAGVVTLEAGARFASPGEDGRVGLVVRPDHILLPGDSGHPATEAEVVTQCEDILFLGTHVRLDLRTATGVAISVHVPPFRVVEHAIAVGSELRVGWTVAGRKIIENAP
ncbi:MAG: TOBE domain-containing protein, partial [Rhizobiaceae bacterium]|nr:TOBE domain-containing protein [Rhizobiaceae bacterium]